MCSAQGYVGSLLGPHLISMVEHITLRVVDCLIAEFKIQIFQVNLAALVSEHSRVKAPRLFWANLYEIPNRTWT